MCVRVFAACVGQADGGDQACNPHAVRSSTVRWVSPCFLLRLILVHAAHLCWLPRCCRHITINVEYNQLDPLLRATIAPEGDVNDDTGFSPFPGQWVGGGISSQWVGGGISSGFMGALVCVAIAPEFDNANFSAFPQSVGGWAGCGWVVQGEGWWQGWAVMRTHGQPAEGSRLCSYMPCAAPAPAAGNINQLVLKLSTYCAELHRHGGVIAEFVNPK